MENLNWQHVRFSVLWVAAVVAVFIYSSFAASVETSENFNNLSLVVPADLVGFLLAALLFALLSLLLKGRFNRLLNLIAGAVMAIGALAVLIDGVTVHFTGVYNLMMVAAVILLASIWWLALRAPRTA